MFNSFLEKRLLFFGLIFCFLGQGVALAAGAPSTDCKLDFAKKSRITRLKIPSGVQKLYFRMRQNEGFTSRSIMPSFEILPGSDGSAFIVRLESDSRIKLECGDVQVVVANLEEGFKHQVTSRQNGTPVRVAEGRNDAGYEVDLKRPERVLPAESQFPSQQNPPVILNPKNLKGFDAKAYHKFLNPNGKWSATSFWLESREIGLIDCEGLALKKSPLRAFDPYTQSNVINESAVLRFENLENACISSALGRSESMLLTFTVRKTSPGFTNPRFKGTVSIYRMHAFRIWTPFDASPEPEYSENASFERANGYSPLLRFVTFSSYDTTYYIAPVASEPINLECKSYVETFKNWTLPWGQRTLECNSVSDKGQPGLAKLKLNLQQED